ncbi:MAG TPA: hypothetical protein PK805_10845, partial [Acidovorax temperans]|nr:hypothetical protein [Acidovorax temperans]
MLSRQFRVLFQRPSKQALRRPVATAQGPPRSAGGVPLPDLRSKAREGGSGAAAQGDVPKLFNDVLAKPLFGNLGSGAIGL